MKQIEKIEFCSFGSVFALQRKKFLEGFHYRINVHCETMKNIIIKFGISSRGIVFCFQIWKIYFLFVCIKNTLKINIFKNLQ